MEQKQGLELEPSDYKGAKICAPNMATDTLKRTEATTARPDLFGAAIVFETFRTNSLNELQERRLMSRLTLENVGCENLVE